MAALLIQGYGEEKAAATVTVADYFSKDLKQYCQLADVIVIAVGQPKCITQDMVKEGAAVIDVGINRIPDSTKKSGFQLVGDVDFENVAPKCSFITPVPGGVGPVTVAILLQNTLLSFKRSIAA